MSNALAVEGRFKVISFLKSWVDKGQLSYKFSVHENQLEPTRVRATFSKPTPESPATAAVAHLYFHLDDRLQNVLGFTVESEKHYHSLSDLRFDEAIIDHVIRRKLVLKQQNLVRLSDEFSSTRVPALMKQRDEDKRNHDREGLEEYLLERLQRKDPYNDGRISFQECKDVLYGLELPSLSRRDREILLAFVELDRDDLVDYGAVISIGAEVIDALLNVPEPVETKASAKGYDGSASASVVTWFQATTRHHQQATMHRLDNVLDTFRPPPPTPPQPSETLPAEASEPAMTSDNGSTEDKATANNETDPNAQGAPEELYISRRQLRTSLESPQLLLSRAEINLIVALATPTPSGQIPCSQLHELLQHVQTMVFRFQLRCFTDRIEEYLRQQFMNYESSKLQGSAEHLKKRLRQKEIKTVVKDMKKLLLTPYQAAHIVALADATESDPDRVVHYAEYVEHIAEYLRSQVDPGSLQARARVWDAMAPGLLSVPDEDLVRQHCAEAFEIADTQQLGTIAVPAFRSSIVSVIEALALAIPATEMGVIAALADPAAQGRVNCVYFQQLAGPVLQYFDVEARVNQFSHEREADTKKCDEGDETKAEK